MATALPKQTERSKDNAINLFEGLTTFNLPVAPSHPVVLNSSNVSIVGSTSFLENQAANHIHDELKEIESSTKLSKLYTSEDDIQKRSGNSYPILPSLHPTSTLNSAGMPLFSTYLPQPLGASPLKQEQEDESEMTSESTSLLPRDPLRLSQRVDSNSNSNSNLIPPPPPAGTRAVSSALHRPQPQTQLNRLNPSMSYLPNNAGQYSTPLPQHTETNPSADVGENTLVDELVNENWRLSQEVLSLRAVIAQSPGGGDTGALSLNTHAASSVATMGPFVNTQGGYMSQQFRQQPPAGRVLGSVISPGGQSRPITPYAISSVSPTMNPMSTGSSSGAAGPSTSSQSRPGRVSNGVYQPVSTSSSAEIELQDRPSTAGGRVVSEASTAPSAPALSVPSSTTTSNIRSSEQTKYLCCGGCRQWLSSPLDAEYVYCPTCQSVNHCPRPTLPQVSYRDANGNIVPAESFEWYAPLLPLADCVRNLFR